MSVYILIGHMLVRPVFAQMYPVSRASSFIGRSSGGPFISNPAVIVSRSSGKVLNVYSETPFGVNELRIYWLSALAHFPKHAWAVSFATREFDVYREQWFSMTYSRIVTDSLAMGFSLGGLLQMPGILQRKIWPTWQGGLIWRGPYGLQFGGEISHTSWAMTGVGSVSQFAASASAELSPAAELRIRISFDIANGTGYAYEAIFRPVRELEISTGFDSGRNLIFGRIAFAIGPIKASGSASWHHILGLSRGGALYVLL